MTSPKEMHLESVSAEVCVTPHPLPPSDSQMGTPDLKLPRSGLLPLSQ